MAEPQKPVLIKPIPPIVINEGAPFGPIDLRDYIQSPHPECGLLRFYGELAEEYGDLPAGLECLIDGLLGGVPAAGTLGNYKINIIAENDSDESLVVEVPITINAKAPIDDPFFLHNFKTQVWDALGKNLPLPELGELLTLPITPIEIYYLLQRYSVLTVWDVYNLEPPGELKLLNLAGTSKHFNIYDRGSCLVAGPKDLFSHERTIADAIATAKVLAGEIYKRGWTIEFAGLHQMARAAWVELQVLGQKHGKTLEVLHYNATEKDFKLIAAQSQIKGPTA